MLHWLSVTRQARNALLWNAHKAANHIPVIRLLFTAFDWTQPSAPYSVDAATSLLRVSQKITLFWSSSFAIAWLLSMSEFVALSLEVDVRCDSVCSCHGFSQQTCFLRKSGRCALTGARIGYLVAKEFSRTASFVFHLGHCCHFDVGAARRQG